ncbi:translocation/assembly module TamB domain-containing protein [Roseobacter sinensis]|uniref:Translocation/assembly module TamB domain-containing protein n=1 Tax=Roseobacter sinensis TaxID=2931391 RepID=A0ABT3BK70_9RHOB|nr:translocation/assembly module TamB domain-containing protein [Roseobacter sp. WL0113]MCV3273973.1 translocation/assembly module TamB domain-containing protein [Roseobacter sp. WL0113]
MRLLRLFALICLLATPWAVSAQEDDGGFLTRTLEDLLSGAGREVNIEGFEGALSSEASFDRMTIADDQGIWLTLEDVRLNWSRLALLRGRLEVNRLSAAVLELPRLPEAEETTEIPSAEATEFALPDLPVSINIERIELERISLGAPILGAAAELGMEASARLDDDGAALDLTANRLDAAQGTYVVNGSFQRATSEIAVQMELDEEAGGLVGRLMNLPGQPSLDLTVAGRGPLDDFAADITLATDGQPRVAGEVVLSALPVETDGAPPDRRVRADLGGDITALVAPQSRDFFGPDVRIALDALLRAEGGVDVQAFDLDAQSAQLAGALRLNADNWPVFIDVGGQIARSDGAPVILPGADVETAVQQVTLSVQYDAANGDAFRGAFDLRELARDDLSLDTARLILDGTLQSALATVGRFQGDLDLTATGLALSDPNAAQAVGQTVTGSANIDYVEDQPIRITGLELTGDDYGLAGDIVVDGLAGGFPTELDLEVRAEDLARFAGLAGQPIAGGAELAVAGTVTPLSSMFDLAIGGVTTDLTVGIPQADAVLAGRTELSLTARRDASGTFVEELDLGNDALELTGDFDLQTDNSVVSARAALRDIGLVLPQYEGPVTVVAEANQDSSGWLVDLQADAPYDSTLSVTGRATGPQTDVSFDLSVPELRPLVPSVQGPLEAAGRVWLTGAGYNVDVDADGPFRSTVSVEGLATGPEAAVTFSAALPDISVFVPQIRGPLSVAGDARRTPEGWQVDTGAAGPAGTDAAITGLVREDGTVALDVAGALPLGLSEPFLAPRSLQGQAQFDLAVNGAPSLEAVSGRITVDGARFAAPNLRLVLSDLESTLDLAGGRLQINAESAVETGGQIAASGSLNLASLAADLDVALRSVGFVDPRLFSTVLDGAISIDGPLTGGARIAGTIDVGETLVTVPSSGITSIGEIPDITHLNAPADVTATRRRAGVIPEPAASGPGTRAAAYRLGLRINAPQRIFVRGRGIDAELGGALEIGGTTARLVSAGQFELVRGRLDILGRRFDLVEGLIQFQGDLVPYIRFVTSTNTESGTAGVVLEGPADTPDVSFVSTPDAPEDQVLSQLLFGRDISEISAFQALQLANAVATLAGREGVGLIGNLREGFGLDDLDITTTEDGAAAVRAGRYISENIYTDVVTGGGETELSINLDVTDSLKARGTLEQDGNTGVGIFFERDY